MTTSEEEKLKRLQLGLAESSTLFRAGIALLALPFLLVFALACLAVIYFSVSALIG